MYQRIPYDLEQKLERELQAEESVEWQGMPVPRFFTAKSLAMFLFAIPWTAFAIFWICGAAGFKLPDLSEGFSPLMLFPLFGVPFVLVGLGMLASPLLSYLKDQKTLYAITNKRVIIISGGKTVEIKSFKPEQITEVTRRERKDLGDLVIGQKFWQDSDRGRKSEEIGLFNIMNVLEANKALQKLLESHCEDTSETTDWRLRE